MHKIGIFFAGLAFIAGFHSAWLCTSMPRTKPRRVLGLALAFRNSRVVQAAPARGATLASESLKTAFCSHLHPLKQAMQAGGIQIRAQPHSGIPIRTQANCRINLKELVRRFGPVTAELYEERCFFNRSDLNLDGAYFWCATCKNGLAVVHPDEAETGTPWFPLVSELHPGDCTACQTKLHEHVK